MTRQRDEDGPAVVISCEHASREIPPEYRSLFVSPEAQAALKSHRGWDPGSLQLGKAFARKLSAPLITADVSRLVIELNRSIDHPQLFSEWMNALPRAQRDRVRKSLYDPYRKQVDDALSAALTTHRAVVHVSMHSFSPVWKERRRPTDIGLLYDPARHIEARLCRLWRNTLRDLLPKRTTHLNRPYRGWTDGLPTALRKRFAADRYVGIELEVNQRFPLGRADEWRGLCRLLADSFATSLQDLASE